MAKTNDKRTVLRHGPIERLEEITWTVEGTLRGMSLKRVMTLVRLTDGRIVIHSAVPWMTTPWPRSRGGVGRRFSWSPSATTVFNDAVFNISHGKGLSWFIFRHITGSTGGPRVTRLFRMLAIKDKAALRGHLERLAGTPDLVRIIVSRHEPIADRPAEVLRGVAAAV